MSIAVMANVARLSESAIDGLRKFASSGHAVLFTLGDKVDKARYREMLFGQWRRSVSLSTRFHRHRRRQRTARGVRIVSNSLELPWLGDHFEPTRVDR